MILTGSKSAADNFLRLEFYKFIDYFIIFNYYFKWIKNPTSFLKVQLPYVRYYFLSNLFH
jgi:hypothetical protein